MVAVVGMKVHCIKKFSQNKWQENFISVNDKQITLVDDYNNELTVKKDMSWVHTDREATEK